MTSREQAHWRRVRDIFDIATEADSAKRRAALEELCAGDGELLAEVENLLALRKQSGLALDRPPVPCRYQPGDLVGGSYRIVRFLARGGMGEVYEAEDSQRNLVAVKFVRQAKEDDGPAQARFLREVRMARKIEHPNVCRILDLDEHDGYSFCVMELLRGETLAAKLDREGKMTPAEALPIALQLCDGLQAAHQAGVLHRDLKPGNIFLENGRAVIIDFGLAAASAAAIRGDTLTATGAVIGTLAYMAPEQLEEGRGGSPADLYSLGVILYEMLTGTKPHDAKSPFRLAAQKARESHRTPSGIAVPAVWREVVVRCLKARPDDRFPDAAALKRALLRSRPSALYVISQPRIFFPLTALLAGLLACVIWLWAREDYHPQAEAAQLYSQANEAMLGDSPMRAVTALEQAITLDPKFLNARSLLAVAHAETDQMDKAKDALLQANATRSERWFIGRGEARALDAANAAVVHDFLNAAEQYGRLALLPGNREFALLSRARMLQQAGKFDLAIHTVEGVIQSASIPAAHAAMAQLLARKGDPERTASEFHKAEAMYEKSRNQEGLCDVLIARVSSHIQDPKDDRADLERAIDISVRKTGNRYQYLIARDRMVRVLESERNYEGAIALAREVAAEAQQEGMLTLAATATADLGYAYMFLKDVGQAAVVLRQAIDLAGRAKSYTLLNSIRCRLGEALSLLGKKDEAIAVMESAVEWYRKDGGANGLPLILIKWGTVLNNSRRFAEAPGAFEEAYRLAERSGDDTYKVMALQRLAGIQEDQRKAQQYWGRVLVYGESMRLTNFYFKAANAWMALGEFDRASQLIDQGAKQAREKYPEGFDRRSLLDQAASARAFLYFVEGRCAEAASLWAGLSAKLYDSDFHLRRARACAGASAASIRRDLAWMEPRIPGLATGNSIYAADLALRVAAWPAAKRHALRGIEASRAVHVKGRELENTLALRAAEAQLGNRTEADRLGGEIMTLAREIGFSGKPGDFGGRQDLLYFWKLGNRLPARASQ